jgi:hypothetical protein
VSRVGLPHRRPGFLGWLTSLIPPAPPPARDVELPPLSPGRGWAEALGVWALFFLPATVAAGLYLGGALAPGASPTTAHDVVTGLSELAMAGLALVVVLALTRLRGLRLDRVGWRPAWARPSAYRWQAFGAGTLFLAAVVASALLLGAVDHHASYPFNGRSATNLIYEIPAAINAGFVEELVVVALFVTVAEQLRLRPWLIYLLGVALRLSYHVYYGSGVWTFALWAATAIWLFRRCRRVAPLIAAHIVYDALGSAQYELNGFPVVVSALIGWAVLGVIVLVIVRATAIARRRQPRGQLPAP